MSEITFWSEFYSKNAAQVPADHSSFAAFVIEWMKENDHFPVSNKTLIDLGCGTARDSRFFANQGMKVMGVDQAPNTIQMNNERKGPNETYWVDDFSHITDERCTELDFIYSRFSIHSISKKNASDLYQWTAKSLKQGGLFLIEARSINDPLFKLGTPDPAGDPDASISGHYRRFIRLPELIKELSSHGLTIVYQHEGENLSVCGDDNPVLLRVICQK